MFSQDMSFTPPKKDIEVSPQALRTPVTLKTPPKVEEKLKSEWARDPPISVSHNEYLQILF